MAAAITLAGYQATSEQPPTLSSEAELPDDSASKTPNELPEPDAASTKRVPPAVEQLGVNKPRSPEQIDPGKIGQLRPSVLLSIQDSRAAALQGNLDLRIAQVLPRITAQGIREQNWRFEPFLTGTFSRDEVNLPSALAPSGSRQFSNLASVSDVVRPTLNFPSPTGGTFTILDTYNRSAIDFLPTIFDQSFGFGMQQELLRGGGFTVNLAPIRVARLENAAADANARLASIVVLAAVEQAYWLLYGARQQTDIFQRQLELAEEQLRMAQRLADAKVVARIETLRAESGVALRRGAVIVAQTDVRLRERDLKQVMQRFDMPVESFTEIVPLTSPRPTPVNFDRAGLESFAFANRMELRENAYRLDINAIAIEVARNGVLPQVQFNFFSRLLGTGTTSGSSAAQLRSNDYNEWFAGLSASVPLAANQSAIARVRQTELAQSRVRILRRQLEVAIGKEVNDAVDRLEQNWRRILAARQAVDAARRAFQAERRLFELGQRAGDLVLDAASRLRDAELQELFAVVDYMIARAQLAVATGSMIGYGGVEWVANDAPASVPLELIPPGRPQP